MLLRHLRLHRHLPAYVDGEAAEVVRARLRAHVRECSRCSEESELQRVVSAALRAQGGRRPSPPPVLRLRRWARTVGVGEGH